MEVITTDAMRTVADAAGWDAGLQYDVYQKEEKTSAGKGYLFIKRTFDIAASVAAGIVLLLPMLLVAVLVRIDSHGPALFRQERLGKDGKPFTMLKFRTMYTYAPANMATNEIDMRKYTTKLGKFLREYSIDELPQLWNVFIGNMSFVGYRPVCLSENKLNSLRKKYGVFGMKPGITGYAQVSGRDNIGTDEKARMDLFYVEHCSVALDICCILKTVKTVLTREGVK